MYLLSINETKLSTIEVYLNLQNTLHKNMSIYLFKITTLFLVTSTLSG